MAGGVAERCVCCGAPSKPSPGTPWGGLRLRALGAGGDWGRATLTPGSACLGISPQPREQATLAGPPDR